MRSPGDIDCKIVEFDTNLNSIGSFTQGISAPLDMTFDVNGNLFVMSWGSSGGAIEKYSASGEYLGVFGSSVFVGGGNIAFAPSGNLYYTSGNTVRSLSPSGADLGIVLSTNTIEVGGFDFAADGTIYLATSNSNILKYSDIGTLIGEFASNIYDNTEPNFDSEGNSLGHFAEGF